MLRRRGPSSPSLRRVIVLDLNVDVLGNTRFAFSPLSELACSVVGADVRRTLRPARRLGAVGAAAGGSRRRPAAAGRPPARPLGTGLPVPRRRRPRRLPRRPARRPGRGRRRRGREGAHRRLGPAARCPRSPAARWTVRCGSARCWPTELRTYWDAALAPHWPRVRGTLEEDVAHRAGQTLRGGLFDLLADLHHEVSVDGAVLRIDKPHHDDVTLPGRPPHPRPRRLHLAAPAARPLLPRRVPAHLPGAGRRAAVGGDRRRARTARRPRLAARPHPRHRADQPGGADVDHLAVARARPEPGDDQPAPRRPARVRHGAVVAVRAVGALPADRAGRLARRRRPPH